MGDPGGLRGQSLGSFISTARTPHQIAPVLTSLLSTTWLGFGVGRNIGPVGDFGMPGDPANKTDRSTEDACIRVATAGLLLRASGMYPNRVINFSPSATPQNSPDRPPSGQSIASRAFVEVTNIGTST